MKYEIEDKLRGVEKELEEIGCSICSVNGGGDSWNELNKALSHIREAIHNVYKIEE